MQLPPPGSDSVLPPTTTIQVLLVVANAGNVIESPVWASATVQPDASSFGKAKVPPINTVGSRIRRLAAGASKAVRMPKLSVEPGGSYTLSVSVGLGALPSGPVNSTNGVGQTDTVRITVAAA